MHITKERFAVEFSSLSTPLTFSSTDDVLFQVSYQSSYSVMLWVRWGVTPSPSSVVAELSSQGQSLITVTKASDGKWTASAAGLNGLVTVTSSVYAMTVWTHVMVSACSVTSELSLFVTQWQGATSSYSTSATAFNALSPESTTLTLGSGFIGLVLDCRLATSCLTQTDVTSVTLSAVCSSRCGSGCFGPGDRACNDYIQLTDETDPLNVAGDRFTWTRDDPHLQGHSFAGSTYSFTGWYYQSDLFSAANLFRSANVPGDCCDPGQRVVLLNLPVGGPLSVVTDLSLLPSWENTANVPPYIDTWMFVGVAISPGSVKVCIALFSDLFPTCDSYSLPLGNTSESWGTSSASTLSLGDTQLMGVVGMIADQRYYFNSAVDLLNSFARRNTYCGESCTSCSSPFDCSYCAPGHYLDTSGASDKCRLCNACCVSCIGAGSNLCISCASPCQLTPANECISN